MTAGERIGEHSTSEDQGELSGIPENLHNTQVEKPKRRSLFAMFSRSKDPEPANSGEETSDEDTTVVSFEPEAHPQHVSAETKLSDSSGDVVEPIQPAEIVVINVMPRRVHAITPKRLQIPQIKLLVHVYPWMFSYSGINFG